MEDQLKRMSMSGNTNARKWTTDQDAALTKHRADGYSGAQAASLINREFQTGFSRNAIIGRLHRLGLTDRTDPIRIKQYVSRSPKEPGVPRARPERRALPAEIIELRCIEIVPRNLSLMDLESADCRYPYGEGPFTFCGHSKMEHSSYCFAHFHLTRGNGTSSERAAANVSSKLLETAWG